MLEFAQQLVNMAEGLLGRFYEPTVIAAFGLTLIFSARAVSRIAAFLALRETKHVPVTRTESIVEIRLGEVHSGSWEMAASACSQTPAVEVTSSNAA